MSGSWNIRFERTFETEFKALNDDVKGTLVGCARVLAQNGPSLGRPLADTLRKSQFPNMKELRFNADDGVWRVAFAFDHKSRGILLVAGDKADLWGKDEEKFYEGLIATADARFEAYLERTKKHEEEQDRKAKK